MSLRSALAVCGALLGLYSLPVLADDPVLVCPARLAVAQTVGGQQHAGWKPFGTDKSHPFTHVTFWLGAPDMAAELVPNKEERKGKRAFATWNFPDNGGEYWVACNYGETAAMVATPLGKDVASCIVEYDPSFSRPVVKAWSCRSRPVR